MTPQAKGSERTESRERPLDAARGMLLGVVLGSALWTIAIGGWIILR